MKLVYVIALGHSGSTLIDCILGTHPDFFSSGELRYLNWQLERTKACKATVQAQNICTCGDYFRNCKFWSRVFKRIHEQTGYNIVESPRSFDTAYFKQFSDQNRGGFKRRLPDKIKGTVVRHWLEQGWPLKRIAWIAKQLPVWLSNNWLLYEFMSEVSGKPVIVDSTKHLTIALLLQQYRPQDVTILFVHRKVEGLVGSAKRWARKANQTYSLSDVVQSYQKFQQRVDLYKKNISDLSYIEVNYEDFVAKHADFLEQMVSKMDVCARYSRQTNSEFYIDPSLLHIVAGNPMRYKGRQLVKYDDRWKTELTEMERTRLQNLS